jgi:fructose 1,6-bisphosphatase
MRPSTQQASFIAGCSFGKQDPAFCFLLTRSDLGFLQAGKILGIGLCHSAAASWMLVAHAGSMPELVSQPDLNSVSQEVVKQQDFVGIGLRGAWVYPK